MCPELFIGKYVWIRTEDVCGARTIV